ncbi:MAG: Hsp70 family protein, partial [Anaerolinea sp.]|nr:Hsp70 family protein [Anaerolinea sp.]
ARIDEYGQPREVANSEGEYTTPSVVYFSGTERIVGNEAKNVSVVEKDNVKTMVKREIGLTNTAFIHDGRSYAPEEISSFILEKLVKDAQQSLGIPVNDVVITCPAYFGIPEREATRNAGLIAGLNVRDIISEPTAAALAYGIRSGEDQVLLVYDLGGGTFDITLLEVKGKEFSPIVTGGERALGGHDWDTVIVNYLIQCWEDEHGSDSGIKDDLNTLQDLYLKAESAKKTLSTSLTANIAVRYLDRASKVVLTREKFDELTAGLLERTIMHTKNVLEDAKKQGYTRFDQFLLVGGSSKMPQVKAKIIEVFGVEPLLREPDFLVARGAALYGHHLALGDAIMDGLLKKGFKIDEGTSIKDAVSNPSISDAVQEIAEDISQNNEYFIGIDPKKLVDMATISIGAITSHSFGVLAWNRENVQKVVNLVKRNDRVPVEISQIFGTRDPNQPAADIQVFENDVMEHEAEQFQSTELGMYTLPLPPGLPANSQIEVQMQLDKSGMLTVTARDPFTGKEIQGNLQTNRILSEAEIEEARRHNRGLSIR